MTQGIQMNSTPYHGGYPSSTSGSFGNGLNGTSSGSIPNTSQYSFNTSGTRPNPWTSATATAQQGIGYVMEEMIIRTPDLPPIKFLGYDEQDNQVYMTLKPETNITPLESVRISMLLTVAAVTGDCNPYLFVKDKGLERHFTYSQTE